MNEEENGFLTGAMSGAATGSMIAPGIGTAIGAGVGALVGLYQGSRARRARVSAERRREALERANAQNQSVLRQQNETLAAGRLNQDTFTGSYENYSTPTRGSDNNAPGNVLSSAGTF